MVDAAHFIGFVVVDSVDVWLHNYSFPDEAPSPRREGLDVARCAPLLQRQAFPKF
jgi:hypothetical protein